MNIPKQTFIQVYEAIIDQEDLNANEILALCKLLALGSAPKGCIISNEELAKFLKTSIRNVGKILKSLKDKDYIIPIYTKKHGFVDNRKIEFTLKTKLLLGVTTGIPQPKYTVRNQQEKPQKPQKPQQKPQKPQQNKPVSCDLEAIIKNGIDEVDKQKPSSLNANKEYGF